MGGIEKKKIWTGIFIVPPVIFLIALGPSFVLPLIVLLATFFGLREFYKLALPQSKWVERFMGIGLGLVLCSLISFGGVSVILLFFVLILLYLLKETR